MNAIELATSVRPITTDEAAFYHEHGWVKLDQLVAPAVVAEARDAAEEHLADVETKSFGRTRPGLAREGIEPFHSLVFNETMAANAGQLANRRRLTDREIGLRYRCDILHRKHGGGEGTAYHQDSSEHGSDRVGEMQFWLALDEVTPELGAMRFLSGSHREGPLGSIARIRADGSATTLEVDDLLAVYPKLAELYELSSPFHYQPGDATVHHGYMLHGAPPNTSNRDRLNFLFSYVPADTRWWGGHTGNSGSERVLLADEEYPIVCGPSAGR
jgi:ectoine hydroxylase-related dioxygenase (phytanoyl-CoA dioxygenase family)